jgi:hypothetical protein
MVELQKEDKEGLLNIDELIQLRDSGIDRALVLQLSLIVRLGLVTHQIK